MRLSHKCNIKIVCSNCVYIKNYMWTCGIGNDVLENRCCFRYCLHRLFRQNRYHVSQNMWTNKNWVMQRHWIQFDVYQWPPDGCRSYAQNFFSIDTIWLQRSVELFLMFGVSSVSIHPTEKLRSDNTLYNHVKRNFHSFLSNFHL